MIKSINLKNYIETLESGKRPKGGASNSGVPSLGGEHINLNGGFNLQIDKLKFVPEEYFNSLSKGIIKKNDILIVKDGATTGKVAYVNEDFSLEKACINEHVFLVRPKKEINPKYLFYYFFSNIGQREILKDFRGATVGGISKEFIDIDMYIPKVDEQIEIIKILDKAKSLIDKRKEQIKALDELVKSKFIEMFGDKDKYTYIKIEQLVSNKSDIVDGPFGSNLKTVDYVDDGVRVIQINNIGESNFRDKNKKYITEEKYKSLLKHSVVPGDIVVAKMGEPIGRACILPDYISKAVIVADCMKIRPNLAIINRKYLEFLLNTEEVKAQFRKYSQGSTRVRLNLTMLRQIKVLYPPIELQNQFADFVKQVDKLKFEMEKSLKELEDNFNSLMQKAFKGELFD